MVVQVITEQAVSNVVGLRAMYREVLDFVSERCSLLVQITSMPPSSSSAASTGSGVSTADSAGSGPSAAGGDNLPQLSVAHSSSSNQHFGASVRGIDFLVNAVWPEVVRLIEQQASALYAVGNPDVFHVVSANCLCSGECMCSYYCSVMSLIGNPKVIM